MEVNSKLFLETTIQVDRFSADVNKKKKIDEVIDEFKQILSSSYVKMEFKRRFIQDMVYLYNAAIDAETYADVWSMVNNLNSVYHKRKISGILASFHRFYTEKDKEEIHGPLGDVLLEKVILFFKSSIENAWEDFNRGIDKITDETDCFIAKSEPVLKGDKFDNRIKKCKKEDIKCEVVEFFVKNKETFKKIYEKLSQLDRLDDEQQHIKDTLEKALKNPTVMADRKNCWHCGDAIIAVEPPADAVLFTTNIKHFEPICSEIKKKCLTYRQDKTT